MAIWQFSLYLIPLESVNQMFSEAPSELSMDIAEGTPWWAGHQPKSGFEDAISQILPESPSWSKSLRIWGVERSNAVLVGYLTEARQQVEEIEIRIDTSNLSNEFVLRICNWATDMGCVVRTKTYNLLRPEFFEVHEALVNSCAMRFTQDPVETLKSLKSNEFEPNN